MGLMQVRRRMMAKYQDSILPVGYKRIEYAESDGNAFVQLPFGFDASDEVETKFVVTKTSERMSDKYIVSPSRWNDNSNRFALGIHSAYGINVYTIGFGSESTASSKLSPSTSSDFAIHTWTYKERVFSILELGLSYSAKSINFGGETYPLKLFYGYNTNTAGKISFYNHKHEGILHKIIPIQNIVNGTVEMYDTTTKTIMQRTGILLPPS